MDFSKLQNYLDQQKAIQLAQNSPPPQQPVAGIDPGKYKQFLAGFHGAPDEKEQQNVR